jgi:carboxyl-terminal processing protease
VLQDVPEELKARADTTSEATLRGHLSAQGQTGSQSYVPPDPKNDKALHMALDLIRGTQVNPYLPAETESGSCKLMEHETLIFVLLGPSMAS